MGLGQGWRVAGLLDPHVDAGIPAEAVALPAQPLGGHSAVGSEVPLGKGTYLRRGSCPAGSVPGRALPAASWLPRKK